MANWLARIGRLVARATEGQYRPGPYYLPVTGGWLPADVGQYTNWWQMGYNPIVPSARIALVEACVSAYAQTVAMCPGDHWLSKPDGGRTRQVNSALTRIFRRPNAYQTISDFMLNAVSNLYTDGNAYALALRNNRFEIVELHLMNPRSCAAMIEPESGEIFYSLGGNIVVDKQLDFPTYVPARDVLHLRLKAQDFNPLIGISPILAAAMDIAAGNAILQQQIAFYMNQARPSAVLATDMVLNKEQVDVLRERWNDQVKGLQQGGTPILTAGLKPVSLAQNSVDSQLADVLKLTEQHIALAFRIPLQILGIGGGAPQSSTEALMQQWLATSLGFCLNHIEEAFDGLFGLKGQPDEYCEFNTSVLLRSNFKDRIEGLVRGVQGGILSPNEARATESYGAVAYGSEPRTQQQVVPLSAAGQIPHAPGPPSAPPAPPAGSAAPSGKDSADVKRIGQQQRRALRDGYERELRS
jgi:HK97 family phage portal protein